MLFGGPRFSLYLLFFLFTGGCVGGLCFLSIMMFVCRVYASACIFVWFVLSVASLFSVGFLFWLYCVLCWVPFNDTLYRI